MTHWWSLRGRRKRQAGVMVAAGVCVSVALSGCSGLPTTSGVTDGQALDGHERVEPLSVKPDGPVASDSQRQVAVGFIRAHIDDSDEYGVARSFLTQEASERWQPRANTRVFDTARDLKVTTRSASRVDVQVTQVGSLSADGHFQRLPTPRPVTLSLQLSHTPNGWRVNRTPENLGLWLSQGDLDRLYSQVNIYYPLRGSTRLVPDVRWVLRRDQTAQLVRAALSPPPSWLNGAVSSPYPDGVKPAARPVDVHEDGVAHVELSAEASLASPAQRQAMWAALSATMMQAVGVTGVTLSSNGAELGAPGASGAVSSPTAVGFSVDDSPQTSVMVRSGGYLAWAQSSASDAVAGTTPEAAKNRPTLVSVSPQWTQLAAGRAGAVIAGISRDRRELAIFADGKRATPDTDAHSLLRPLVDPRGWVIIAGEQGSSQQTQIWSATAASRSLGSLDSSPLRGRQVTSWAMSPDGSRIAMVVRDATDQSSETPKKTTTKTPMKSATKGSAAQQGSERSPQIVVAAVKRDSSGRPVGLGEPVSFPTQVTQIRAITWSDLTNLAVLGRFAGADQPVLLGSNGSVTPLGASASASDITSTFNGADGLFLRRTGGQVMTRQASTWLSFLSGGDVIVPLG